MDAEGGVCEGGSSAPAGARDLEEGMTTSANGPTELDAALRERFGEKVDPELVEAYRAAFLSPGDRVADRFKIVRLLRLSALGAVYEADDERIEGRAVALEMILPLWLPTAEDRERFRAAAEAMTALQDEPVAAIIEVGFAGDVCYLCEELVDGPDFAALNRQPRRPTVTDACEILTRVCDAVACAHGQGAYHGMLHPAAILVLPDARVKTTDFGLASALSPERFRRLAEVAGALPYMAPELREDPSRVSGAADVYAVGAMLYESMTGAPPDEDWDPPTILDDLLPTEADTVALTCLAEDPDERVSSADELRDMVDALASTLGNMATSQTAIIETAPDDSTVLGAARFRDDDETKLETVNVGVLPHELEREGWRAEEGRTIEALTPQGIVRRDVHCFTNSLGMRFVRVQKGEFQMGSPETEPERGEDEGPLHSARIWRTVYMGVTPVLQRQYEYVMGVSVSKFIGADRPVESVTWQEAAEFCRQLSHRENVDYRLPSEAEWEYACRAGSANAYYWGDEFLDDAVWHAGNSDGETHDVAQKAPNGLGLYDMSGHVWEWTGDWYDPEFYAAGFRLDPKGPAEGERKVIRGGSWASHPRLLRSAARDSIAPDQARDTVGFRVVCVCSLRARQRVF